MALPLSVDSNITGLAYAEEASLKTLPVTPTWYSLEPNSYSNFGADFPSVARDTINATRQKLRGTITDMAVGGEFSIDLTQRNLMRLMQGFMFATATEKPATAPLNGTQIPITATAVDGFTATAGLTIFLARHLILARNFGVAANNGLAFVSAAIATKVTTTKALTVEAAPPANAHIQAVGYRGAAGDLKIAISGAQVQLNSTTLNFTTLGLSVGEWIFIGGDAAINQFVTSATTPFPNYGYARILTIAANRLTFDLTTFTPATDADAGGLQQVDIYFGKVINNATTAAGIVRRTYQLERQLGNDGIGTFQQAEYITGAVPNKFTLNQPTANKITVDLGFVGLGYETVTGTVGPKSGVRNAALGEPAFNTSHDIFLTRLSIVDPLTLNPTALFAYASDLKLDIDNGADPVKALGVLGGFNATVSDFNVTGQVTAYFQSIAAIAQIKNNADCCLTSIIARNNAGMVFDIPMLTLGGGENKVTKDKPITLSLTQDAAKNAAGYTMMACFFEYLPSIAQPV